MTDTDIRALATEANAAGDYATVAMCMLALGYSRADMRIHVAAACPPRIRAAGARRILRAAQDQRPR
jgi:hypothetical protein